MSRERSVGDTDPDPVEARPEQHGPMCGAVQPDVDDPLGRQSGRPGEVLAEEGTAGAGCERARGDGPVGEVLAADHVRRVATGGANKVEVDPQWGEPVARSNRVHRLEEGGGRSGDGAGLGSGGGPHEGEKRQKRDENPVFSKHPRQFGVGFWGLHPPKGVRRGLRRAGSRGKQYQPG